MRRRPDWWHDEQADRMWLIGQDTAGLILLYLRHKPMASSQLARKVRRTRQAVDVHLRKMLRLGMVRVVRLEPRLPRSTRIWGLPEREPAAGAHP